MKSVRKLVRTFKSCIAGRKLLVSKLLWYESEQDMVVHACSTRLNSCHLGAGDDPGTHWVIPILEQKNKRPKVGNYIEN